MQTDGLLKKNDSGKSWLITPKGIQELEVLTIELRVFYPFSARFLRVFYAFSTRYLRVLIV